MAKINELQKYINYEFSSGPYTGKDYKTFETKYINYIRSFSKENGWEVVTISDMFKANGKQLQGGQIYTRS